MRRLFTVSAVALVAGLVGVGAGILIAPAKGKETRATISNAIDTHGPTIATGLRSAGNAIGDAFDYVRTQFAAATTSTGDDS